MKKLLFLCALTFPTLNLAAIAIDVYGGYNIAGGKAYSDFDSLVSTLDTTYRTVGFSTSGASPTKGGIAGGADLWFGMAGLDAGLGIGYQPILDVDWQATRSTPYSGIRSAGVKGTVALIPVFAQMRVSLSSFVLGAGIGYGIGTGKASSSLNGATVSDSSVGGSVGGMMVMAGYNIVDTTVVKIGIDARFYLWLDDSTYYHFIPSLRAEVGF